MNDQALDRVLKHIEHGGMPPTIGYAIDERIFSMIAETAVKNISRWGWDGYVDYMNAWRLKVHND